MNEKSDNTFSAEQKKSVLAAISAGLTLSSAAHGIGWPPDKLQSLILADSELQEQIRQAEENAEMYFVMRVREAAKAPQSWRAAAWWLERRKPNQYATTKPGALTLENVENLIKGIFEILHEKVPDTYEGQNHRRYQTPCQGFVIVAPCYPCQSLWKRTRWVDSGIEETVQRQSTQTPTHGLTPKDANALPGRLAQRSPYGLTAPLLPYLLLCRITRRGLSKYHAGFATSRCSRLFGGSVLGTTSQHLAVANKAEHKPADSVPMTKEKIR